MPSYTILLLAILQPCTLRDVSKAMVMVVFGYDV